MANYKDNPNKNFKVRNGSMHLRIHVFEPKESPNQEDWYKDLSTFKNMNIINYYYCINVGDIIEDDQGGRFKVLSRHWKWDKNEENKTYPVFEFTVERYVRHGKQNPYML